MKNIYRFLTTIILLQSNCFSQSSIRNTSNSFVDNVESDIKSTTINLFNIDYNGENIPINLTYSHSGIRVGEIENSLGLGWKLQEIGIIKTTVNGSLDYKDGWFGSNYSSDFNDETFIGNCNNNICEPTPSSFNFEDHAPDFFQLNIANEINFDFTYDGLNRDRSHRFLTNPKNCILETFFTNFRTYFGSSTSDVCFKMTDTNGNNYNFISGTEILYSNSNFNTPVDGFYHDFYLQSISNPQQPNEFLNIEYSEEQNIYNPHKEYYSVGFNKYDENNPSSVESIDYNNNIISNVQFFQDQTTQSKTNIRSITTKNLILEFGYTQNPNNGNQLLNSIFVKDITSGNYLFSFEFTYYNLLKANLLKTIKKNDSGGANSQILYNFEYFNDFDFTNYNPYTNPIVNYGKDYFGYFNNSSNTNRFPFQVRLADNSIQSAGNLNPSLYYAKQLSLKKISNKLGGITEFDYKINSGTCKGENISTFYGGGLLLESKLVKPNIGKNKLTKYEYDDLNGFVANTTSPLQNFLKEGDGKKFWSTKLELTNTENLVPSDSTYLAHSTIRGNFFKKITIKNYDYDTMSLESKKIIEFIPNYEGTDFVPKIKKEINYDSMNSIVGETEFSYNQYNTETLESLKITLEKRLIGSPASGNYLINKKYFPIYLNKVRLKNVLKKSFSQSGIMTNTNNFYYTNNGDVIAMKTNKISNTDIFKTVYWYPSDDPLVVNEPFNNDLIQNNIIKPFKIEKFKNSEKLSETKTVYSIDSSTNNLLLPKYLYEMKGTDFNSTLEKKLTYDVYDDLGNILQITKENGQPVSYIWGYNKTKIIAEIENCATINIPNNLIVNAQLASDSGTESSLINALNALRNSTQLNNAMVTTYTFKPLIGISTVTSPNGQTVYYNYDSFGKLINMKDQNGNLIVENKYNYKP